MSVAITCQTCGRYVPRKGYQKHLRNEHGAASDHTDPLPPSSFRQETVNLGGRVVAPVVRNGGVSRAPAPLNRPHRVHPSIPLPGQRVSHRVTASLEPSKKQRDALDQIFLAPEFCLYLLLTHEPAIETRLDAQMFLLRYKREIDGYLPLRNRNELIDLLSGFMLEWSRRTPSHIRLEFDCNIVCNASDSYAHVEGLGDILMDGGSIRGELPPPSLGVSVMIAKEQENYSLAFVYEDTYREPVPTAARVWNREHDEDTLIVTPALKHRGDGKKVQRKTDQGKPGPVRPKLVLSSPRMARASRAPTVQLEFCPLCGKGVERGGMLMHKRDFHGETMYAPSPRQTARRCAWVAIYQGGAPGLGRGKS